MKAKRGWPIALTRDACALHDVATAGTVTGDLADAADRLSQALQIASDVLLAGLRLCLLLELLRNTQEEHGSSSLVPSMSRGHRGVGTTMRRRQADGIRQGTRSTPSLAAAVNCALALRNCCKGAVAGSQALFKSRTAWPKSPLEQARQNACEQGVSIC